MEVTLKNLFLAFLALFNWNNTNNYDPNKPLNTQTYEFYKGSDWDLDDHAEYIIEIEIQEAMLEYHKQYKSFNNEQKQIFCKLQELTNKIFRFLYKWHTKTYTSDEAAEAKIVMNEWKKLDENLEKSIFPE